MGGGAGSSGSTNNEDPCNENPYDDFEYEIAYSLNNQLLQNPFLLLDNDSCDQIEQWQELAQLQFPTSVVNKILNLQNNSNTYPNWDVQTLEGAEGAVVNMDFFPVTISQLPKKPNSNIRYSAEEFLEFYRLNINLWVEGNASNSSFGPSNITGFDEANLWNSNNPLNSIISINITPDSGSVICSSYNIPDTSSTGSWIFTTLQTPWAFSYTEDDNDGPHPVSGNREFGYYLDTNNNYVFYTRGVDRFQSSLIAGIASIMPTSVDEFSGADTLWETMQHNLANFVNSPINGGQAEVNNPIKYRPDWNDIKDVLQGNKPLSDLSCY